LSCPGGFGGLECVELAGQVGLEISDVDESERQPGLVADGTR
jgi:hypothetical protein